MELKELPGQFFDYSIITNQIRNNIKDICGKLNLDEETKINLDQVAQIVNIELKNSYELFHENNWTTMYIPKVTQHGAGITPFDKREQKTPLNFDNELYKLSAYLVHDNLTQNYNPKKVDDNSRKDFYNKLKN